MPVAVLLLFEGVIFISKKEINKLWIWLSSIVFVLFAWMIKGTVVYSVPTEIKNPFKDYFFQNAQNGLTNPNNILTMYASVSPMMAALVWLIVFAGYMLALCIPSKHFLKQN